jgi:outer membrane protein OmpA-like peptidoglycan-associated protein
MKKAFILFFSLFILQQSYAGDLNFETTSEGITRALTEQNKEQKINTRSIKGTGAIKPRGIKVVGKEGGKIVEKTITVYKDQPIHRVNLKIDFDFDSYNIRPESYKLLNELGKALTGKQLTGQPIVIKGHTDSDGAEAYNLRLSLKRGLAVKSYLISSFPISSSLLKVVGYGESMPLVPNTNESNKQINRRVEITTTP